MYKEKNVANYNNITCLRCYVCDKLLTEPTTADHILPRTIFPKGSQNRPTLKIHEECNNAVKSREDRWFTKRLYIRCHRDPIARKGILDFLESAEQGRPEHNKKRHSPKDFADYRLAMTLHEDAALVDGAKTLRFGTRSTDREIEYIKLISKGLVIRNLGFVKVDVEEVIISQYSALRSGKKFESYMDDLNKIFLEDIMNCHMQSWDDRVTYVISPRHRMIFIEFFKQVAYFGSLKVGFPTIYVKEDLPKSERSKCRRSITEE